MFAYSLEIGSVFNTPIRLHWSILIIPFFITQHYIQTNGSAESKNIIIIVIILFVCVLLHELGHSYFANALKIKTKDIIISGFGGLARIQNSSINPKKEWLIALGGPIVNAILFLIGAGYMIFIENEMIQIGSLNTLLFTDYFSIAYKFTFINLCLFVLNLIPAFPLDGGRALRAFIALNRGQLYSTRLMLIISIIISIVLIFIGIKYDMYYFILLAIIINIFTTFESYKFKANSN